MSARTIAATAIAVPALMFGMAGAIGAAYAWPASAEPSSTVTVDGSDYPVCQLEDCSDQPAGIGVWFDPDTGAAWLSTGDESLPIDTGQPVVDMVPAQGLISGPGVWDVALLGERFQVGGWN